MGCVGRRTSLHSREEKLDAVVSVLRKEEDSEEAEEDSAD